VINNILFYSKNILQATSYVSWLPKTSEPGWTTRENRTPRCALIANKDCM